MTLNEYLEKHCTSSCRRDGCPHEEQWELENKLRCGFWGSFFRGEHLLDLDECKQLTDEEYKEAPLGYCPNAQGEAEQQTPDQYKSVKYDYPLLK